MAPALFAGVDPQSRLGQHELFGPVLGVIPVDSMEEAMAVANQVKFGLSASIFTRDLERALTFAREIEAGIVHVNSETAGAEPIAEVSFGEGQRFRTVGGGVYWSCQREVFLWPKYDEDHERLSFSDCKLVSVDGGPLTNGDAERVERLVRTAVENVFV